MAKHKIIASRPLQILGHEDTVEGGTLLGTIETDCEIGALLSALQFGGASIESEKTETTETEADPVRDAIVELINAEISPPLTDKQIVDRLAEQNIKVTAKKVGTVRKSLGA